MYDLFSVPFYSANSLAFSLTRSRSLSRPLSHSLSRALSLSIALFLLPAVRLLSCFPSISFCRSSPLSLSHSIVPSHLPALAHIFCPSLSLSRGWKLIKIKKRKARAYSKRPHSSHPLVATPIGIFATCKRGGFVLQRATKPAKELIAQNPPQDDLQTRATSGLVFARQAAAVDVAGGDSRWQQAGNRSKEAGLVTQQNA